MKKMELMTSETRIPNTGDEAPKSRTQKKKEDHANKRLGADLVALPDDVLRNLDLPDVLREAVSLAKKSTAHGARRRQMQYIGSLLRRMDTAPIRRAVEEMQSGNRQRAAAFHRLERWRDKLCAGDTSIMEEILAACPAADRQRLAQLTRNTVKAAEKGTGSKAGRKLFRYLREVAGDASPR
jgi:ribosome-associated protein